jgi:ADP-heptose:LPS heptosyltransferase
MVVTTPILRCLKQQSECSIHYLCYEKNTNVITSNPYIDKIIPIKKLNRDVLKKLNAEQYDIIIDLHKNLKSFIIKNSLTAKYYSFDKVNLEKWLYVNFKIDRLPSGKHLIDRYFDGISQLNITNDGKGMDFPIPEQEISTFNKNHTLPKQYHVLVLAATYYTKRIPDEKCEDIVAGSRLPVILLGGRDVLDIAQKIHLSFPDKTIDLCGKISLYASAYVITQCDTVFTSDTGLMHISAALQKKIVMVWGCTHPKFGMFPYYGHSHKSLAFDMEVSDLPCRPCSKLGHAECPKKHFKCMREHNFSDNPALKNFINTQKI